MRIVDGRPLDQTGACRYSRSSKQWLTARTMFVFCGRQAPPGGTVRLAQSLRHTGNRILDDRQDPSLPPTGRGRRDPSSPSPAPKRQRRDCRLRLGRSAACTAVFPGRYAGRLRQAVLEAGPPAPRDESGTLAMGKAAAHRPECRARALGPSGSQAQARAQAQAVRPIPGRPATQTQCPGHQCVKGSDVLTPCAQPPCPYEYDDPLWLPL